MKTNDLLPDRLRSGDILVTVTGALATVVESTRKNDDGEPLVRLRFKSGIVGHRFWTRDELQSEGVKIFEQ